MGNTLKQLHWERWYNKKNRKIIVLSYSTKDTLKIIKTLTLNDETINSETNFLNKDIIFKGNTLKYWFLSSTDRHLWIHFLSGLQGVIVYIGEDVDISKIKKELIQFMGMDKINTLPFLFLIEKGSFLSSIEYFRREISLNESVSKDLLFVFLCREMKELIEMRGIEIEESLSWLNKEMKEIRFV